MDTTFEQLPLGIEASDDLRFRNLSSATRVAEFILQNRIMNEGGYIWKPISRAAAISILPDIDWLSFTRRYQGALDASEPAAVLPSSAFSMTDQEYKTFQRTVEHRALEECAPGL
jgi:hypothetical protein